MDTTPRSTKGAALIVLAGFLVGHGFFAIRFLSRFYPLYRDFESVLPLPTRAVVSLRPLGLVTLFLVLDVLTMYSMLTMALRKGWRGVLIPPTINLILSALIVWACYIPMRNTINLLR